MDAVLGIDIDADQIRAAYAGRTSCDLLAVADTSTDLWFSQGGLQVGTLGKPDETVSRWLWAIGRERYNPEIERLARWEAWRLGDDGTDLVAVQVAHEAHSVASLAEHCLAAVHAKVVRAGHSPDAMTLLCAPGGFETRQGESLRSAAIRAGFRVERVIADTTAVALGALDDNFWGTALVIKLGESHAEAAMCDMAPGMLRVTARVSDPHGGLDRVDYRLCDWLIEQATRESFPHARDPRFRQWTLSRIRALRQAEFVDRTVRMPMRGSSGEPRFIEWELPTGMILHAARIAAERATTLCRAALRTAKKQALDLARVVLVGSGARSDRVREALLGLFPRGIAEAPGGAAALGAALHGAGLRGDIDLRLVQEEPPMLLNERLEGDALTRPIDSLLYQRSHADRPPPRPLSEASSGPRRSLPRPPVSLLRPPSRPSAPPPRPAAAPEPPDSLAPLVMPESAVPPPRPSSPAVPLVMPASAVPPPRPSSPSIPLVRPASSAPPPRPSSTAVPPAPAAPAAPAVSESSRPSSRPLPRPSYASVRAVSDSVLPPAAAVMRPSHAAPASSAPIAASGRFRGALSLAEIHALPLAHAPGGEYRPPYHLPYLLMALSHHHELTGKLLLQHGNEAVEVMLFQGGPTMTQGERSRIPRAFHWAEGEYSFHAEAVVPSSAREREPMLTLVATGLKPQLRSHSIQEIMAVFSAHMEDAPVIAPEHHARVRKLAFNPVETRIVEHDFSGQFGFREMVESNPLGRQALVSVVFMLDLVGALGWTAPVRPAHMQPLAQLERELQRLRTKNYFDLIGAHWSASPALLQETYGRFVEEFGPRSRWASVSPEMCREILAMGAAAWRILSDDALRMAYRAQQYPDIDTELLAPLLASRAKSLALKGDDDGVGEMSRLLREISPEQAAVLKQDLLVPLPGGPKPPNKG